MNVIDFHTHYFPPKIMEKAVARLSDAVGVKPYTDGSLEGLIRSMEEAGITYSLNLPLATSPDSERGLNSWAAKYNAAPVYSLGSVHPDSSDPDSILKWIKSLGLKGIKMHPEYQEFDLLEERLEKIWEASVKHDLFILIHAGGDLAYPPPYRSDPPRFAELIRRFPGLRMILAHFGSWNMWDEVEEEIAGKTPYFLDLSFTAGNISDEQLVRIIRTHGAEKIIFGTDSPWNDQKTELEKINRLPLSESEKEMILYENAAKLLQI